jgi:putative NIF3 family GTP cyclohydrolase 1 type 2
MPRLREILSALELIAPARYAFPFDKVGLQVGDPDQNIEQAVVSMDGSLAAVRYGKEIGAQLLLTHHPLIFNPISAVTAKNYNGRVILSLAKEA